MDRVRLSAPTGGEARIDHDEIVPTGRKLFGFDRVVAAWGRGEVGAVPVRLAGDDRPSPCVEVDHPTVVVAEVAQEPPRAPPPRPCSRRRRRRRRRRFPPGRLRGEVLVGRERIERPVCRGRGKIHVDIEEARAGMRPSRYSSRPRGGLPSSAAVDELVAHHLRPIARKCALAPTIEGSSSTARATRTTVSKTLSSSMVSARSARALDSEKALDRRSRPSPARRELVGQMEVGGREEHAAGGRQGAFRR